MARRGAAGAGEPVLITALRQGKSIPEAAQAAQLSPRTVNRRLADPAFQRELAAARARMLGRAVAVLVDGTVYAAAQLRWLAANADQEGIKLAACRSILEYAFRGLETVEMLALGERVAALETERGHQWGA
jgi:hypothetical protein